MKINNIKKYWNNMAINVADPKIVTHRDLNQRKLEINEVLKYLKRKNYVLDIGCGNGYSTAIFADYVKSIVGIDYSAEMISRAKKEYGKKKNIEYLVEDVLKLKSFGVESFDVVISERCLINLTSWVNQKKAIKNIAKVLKKGGRFLLLEGLQDGLNNLNKTREKMGLYSIPVPKYNLNLKQEPLLKFLDKDFTLIEMKKFGLYDFLSRVVYPLLVFPKEPKYGAKINKVAYQITGKLPEVTAFDNIARWIFLALEKK